MANRLTRDTVAEEFDEAAIAVNSATLAACHLRHNTKAFKLAECGIDRRRCKAGLLGGDRRRQERTALQQRVDAQSRAGCGGVGADPGAVGLEQRDDPRGCVEIEVWQSSNHQ